jgi:hypothetical protein
MALKQIVLKFHREGYFSKNDFALIHMRIGASVQSLIGFGEHAG